MNIPTLVLVRDADPNGFNPSNILYRRSDAEARYGFHATLERDVLEFLRECPSAHGFAQAQRLLKHGQLENLPAEMRDFHMIFPGTILREQGPSIYHVPAIVWDGGAWKGDTLRFISFDLSF